MFSGGEITFVRYQDQRQTVGDAEVKGDKVAQENELVFRDAEGKEVRGSALSSDDLITVKGEKITYGAFKQGALNQNTKTIDALKPKEIAAKFATGKKQEATILFKEIKDIKQAISDKSETVIIKSLDGRAPETVAKGNFKAALNDRLSKLQGLMNQIQQANIAASKQTKEGIDPAWTEVVGSQTGIKAGKATAALGESDKKTASTFMYQMGGPDSGVKASGSYYGATPNGGTPAMFQSMPSFTPSSYAAGLYADSAISDGIGQLGKSRSEGQKLMLLFMYFARMAMSGDLGSMYQLIQFINYIIAKDKARQNIQISSKLIQLQDLSRKATETLMSTPTEGKSDKEINEFTKALHKAKSQESTISTSQKLLADMLQEFAHVTEAMTNSSKFLLDAWGRTMRTATRA